MTSNGPLTRADAVYFLASAGAMLSHVGADPAQRAKSAGLVCDALEVLGVSLQELRVATTRGLMGQPSRWNQILTDEFMEQMTVKDKQP